MNTTEFTRNLIAQADLITSDISAIGEEMDLVQFNWKPNPGKWSAGQVIDHVNKANKYYLKELDKILIEGKLKPAGNKKMRSGILGSIALNAIDPENKKKHKSHQLFEPGEESISKDVLKEFSEIQEVLSQYLEMLAAFDLSSAKVSSPANRLIRFRVGDFLSLIITHEKRHLLQIKNLMATAEFPQQVKK